jgi:hypothetical protein
MLYVVRMQTQIAVMNTHVVKRWLEFTFVPASRVSLEMVKSVKVRSSEWKKKNIML